MIVAGVLAVIALVGGICWICDYDREHPLPKPQADSRDWQGAFMKDFK